MLPDYDGQQTRRLVLHTLNFDGNAGVVVLEIILSFRPPYDADVGVDPTISVSK